MIFKRMLGALGIGGPSVDTVLAVPSVQPGQPLAGEVRVQGGDHQVEIQFIALGLVTRVEVEHSEGEHTGTTEFFRTQVSGPFRLAAGELKVVPFQLPIPWETPVTEFYGQHLNGMSLGVRTELAVAKAVDKGDLDPVSIRPLPSQERVLEAFGTLGFQFRKADLEVGHLHGVNQQLPFFQEIEFYPPPQYAGRINEVELTFVANPAGLDIILEADKRAGMFSSGGDSFGRFQVSHEQAVHMDWATEIGRWLDAVAERGHGGHGYGAPGYGAPGHGAPGYGAPGHGAPGYGAPGHGAPGYGGHGYGHGSHGHHDDDHHRRGGGVGMGAVAAAGAAGVVGGFVAAEMIDEVGDFFEGDDDEG
ncbi:sporulation-control protein [Sinosporangium album]|uniref:Sporulation-control protein n=1 Tax=Sinosporangium album TaxID=504805 RepID=A0A1G8FEW7_9ACTN|nr:sporulation protein [Sinosporangium album]SDH80582.1 sporulation-control protein [Sinosporangium album]